MEYSIEEDLDDYVKFSKNLQQRIDKAIEVLNEYKKFCKSKLDFEKDINSPTAHQNVAYWNYCIDKLDYVLSILQEKEIKDNDNDSDNR